MKYYRCYFLTADDHIASAQVLKCAGDDDAKRQCRELAFTNDRYAGAEIWDGARRLYRYPEAADALARESRRKDDATAEPGLELCLVVPPCQSVHAGCSVSLEREERQPEQVDADMVEERGEPFLLPLGSKAAASFSLRRAGREGTKRLISSTSKCPIAMHLCDRDAFL
jgi:hypothetical protein